MNGNKEQTAARDTFSFGKGKARRIE